ncbi:non-ribosomal peptide synthetase [Anaerosporobacter faecicola]|uniref:non-ribosomal peptide synthetase n=1 Tax=Anaerosporobacter faecicola TaxID=2718714 RepID=UPI00143A6301|nr:non-ribosomal peptide synthetase [Anaerosporobacter faecicola]
MIRNYSISSKEFEQAKEYWLNKLAGNIEEVKIPYGHNKEMIGSASEEIMFTLSRKLDEKLTKLCKKSEILLYVYTVAALKILLFRLSGVRDVCVSSPVYSLQNMKKEQGYNRFIVLRDYVKENISFKELLQEVKQTVIEGYKYQYYPMDSISELLGGGQNPISSHNVCLHFESIHSKISCIDELIRDEKCPFVISLEHKKFLNVKLLYNKKVMDGEYAKRILEAYQSVLSQVIKDINISVKDIQLVNKKAIESLQKFNDTFLDFGDVKTITELFEEQENTCSNAIAVTYVKDQMRNYEQLTYRELNRRANQLARNLRSHGANNGDIIGLMVHNSTEVAVGILGILKAGCAYMPIEPSYPDDRIQFMISDSNVRLLVTNCCKERTIPFDGSIIHLSSPDLDHEIDTNLSLRSSSVDPVYVIYTSGSTGTPKGVTVSHRNLYNYVKWRIRSLGHNASDISLQLLSIAFDGFGTNFYPSLLSGGSVVFVDNTYWRDASYVGNVILERKITNFSVVPLIYKMILQNVENERLKSLRFIVLAGERADGSIIELSKKTCPEVRLINEYGPTETTIGTTYSESMDANNTSIIGRPIANNKIYILDSEKQLLPIGVFGELCVVGEGVSLGYGNQAELTAKKFIQSPFAENEIMYKTGDLARWRQDGTIELMGRIDNQVKIMGYRIEPNEIEAVFAGHRYIDKVVVLTCTDQAEHTELCLFFTATKKIMVAEIRQDLARELPDYMIPTYIIQLQEFPLMTNGKVNIAALKRIRQEEAIKQYVAPTNEIEHTLIGIWENVLQNQDIGVNDNFFSIGGNSILVMQVHSLVEKTYPGVTTIPDYFSYPSISELAEYIENRINKTNQKELSSTIGGE